MLSLTHCAAPLLSRGIMRFPPEKVKRFTAPRTQVLFLVIMTPSVRLPIGRDLRTSLSSRLFGLGSRENGIRHGFLEDALRWGVRWFRWPQLEGLRRRNRSFWSQRRGRRCSISRPASSVHAISCNDRSRCPHCWHFAAGMAVSLPHTFSRSWKRRYDDGVGITTSVPRDAKPRKSRRDRRERLLTLMPRSAALPHGRLASLRGGDPP